ncbi:hypothetical protein AVEN_225093-1, partial [Araneus ventricosus]
VYGVNSPTRRIMGELRFIYKYVGKTRSTGTITFAQISNTNRQQFTSKNSNSTFGFSNTNSQQSNNNNSNSTLNSDQLTGFPARTANETPKSFLEGVRTPFIYPCSTGCYVTWKYLACSNISSPNGDIEKMIAYSLIFDLSPMSPHISPSRQNGCQGQGSRPDSCPSLHAYPCKTQFPTIRLARKESDITSL